MSKKGGCGEGASGACLEILVAHVKNNEKMMIFVNPDEIDADVGIPVALSGSTSVDFGSPEEVDADVGNTVAFSGSTSVNFGSLDIFNADVRSTVVSIGSPSVFGKSGNPDEFAGSTGVFDGVGRTIEVMERDNLKKTEKLKQDYFEQGRVLDRVAQTPLILAGAYDMHDSMCPVNDELSHGINENSDSANLYD